MFYFILVGIANDTNEYEMIFGDYLKREVQGELEATKEGGQYRKLQIIRTNDNALEILNVMAKLNRELAKA